MALIAISGKINSGKDTVGKIIQYLTMQSKTAMDKNWDVCIHWCKEYLNNEREIIVPSWEIKKFAGKLKQIVSILTGCSVEDLEDQDFKNSELGEQWRVKHKNWWSENEILKYAHHEGLTLDEYLAKGNHEYLGREKETKIYRAKYLDKNLTYRELLQRLGTEVGRTIHQDIWINALFVEYQIIGGKMIAPKEGEEYTSKYHEYPNWIITDCRFPNELKAVKDRKGITIRVERPVKHKEGIYTTNFEKAIAQTAERQEDEINRSKFSHPSEIALDNAQFHHNIDNNGTIESLIEQVKEILKMEGII